MKDYIEERTILLANYIIENKSTVRNAAKKFCISKSTVHKDITERLKTINPRLAKSVHKILEENKAHRSPDQNRHLGHLDRSDHLPAASGRPSDLCRGRPG